MPEAPPEAGTDSAWVAVATPLKPPALLVLLRDPERLLRVNSQWVFESWESLDSERCRFRIQNRSTGRRWETEARIQLLPDGLRLEYRDGAKATTHPGADWAPHWWRSW